MTFAFSQNLLRFLYASLFMIALFIAPACNRTAQKNASSQNTELKPQQDHRRAKNPLSDYVYTPDESFGYEIAHKEKKTGYTFYILRMVSQQWLTTNEVTDPVWWHWVSIVVPDGKTPDTGFL